MRAEWLNGTSEVSLGAPCQVNAILAHSLYVLRSIFERTLAIVKAQAHKLNVINAVRTQGIHCIYRQRIELQLGTRQIVGRDEKTSQKQEAHLQVSRVLEHIQI
jgi:hypothetical protein